MQILDTTIRDGSYAVDFKFSCKDVRDLVDKSQRIGIDYIEIGHGQGLHASSPEHGIALHSDEEYMEAAKEVSNGAKLGFFCIPGIAEVEDIRIAASHGMKFIRIGIVPNDFTKAFPYIEECKKNDIEVFVNFMKTYSVSPKVFSQAAKEVYSAGARCAYIVDSAGCMCVDDIDKYIGEARTLSDVELGFHGHNNLGLAVDNTLFCIKRGVEFVDCSFQGLGRSLGNASLEQVVMVLEKRGYNTGFDIPRVLEYGYSALRNIVRERLVNPLEYMCGFSGFHSSFLKDIYKCSNEMKVDPLRLILAYSKENIVSMDYEQLREVAKKLPLDIDDNPYNFGDFFTNVYLE